MVAEFEGFAPILRRDGRRAGQQYEIIYMPISALNGDNVVERSPGDGLVSRPPLLELLEEVEVAYDHPHDRPARFPVQWVIRPGANVVAGASVSADAGVLAGAGVTASDGGWAGEDRAEDYRGYSGQLASGALRQGDEVMVLPSGAHTRIAGSRPTTASWRRRWRRCR